MRAKTVYFPLHFGDYRGDWLTASWGRLSLPVNAAF